MTLPSDMLDAIVATLDALLVPTDPAMPRVMVRAIDDTVVGDVTEYNTVALPAVLVTCVTMPVVGRDFGPTTVDAAFVARCIARLPTRSSAPGAPVLSRGDVAMDLAAFVASVVDAEMWGGAALARATRVGARNLGSRELAGKGLSMWVVSWSQQIELTTRDASALLHAFRKLEVALELEGGDSPDAAAHMTMEGRDP